MQYETTTITPKLFAPPENDPYRYTGEPSGGSFESLGYIGTIIAFFTFIGLVLAVGASNGRLEELFDLLRASRN